MIPLALATFISLYLAIFAWRRQRHYIFFVLLMASIAIWASGYAMEIWSSSLNAKIFWAKIEYIGIVFVPVSWFATVLQYTGKEEWIRKKIVFLFIIPVITLFLAWTNEWHHLIWKEVRLAYFGSSSFLEIIHGSYFWIHVAYSYSLILISILLLINALFTFPPLYKWKTVTILIGALIPWSGNILYTFNFNPIYPIDLTPFTSFLGGFAMAFAVLRLKALDIIPIAREKIIEIMEDAVIVIDDENKIIDANKTAKKLFGSGIIGSDANKIFDEKILENKEKEAKIGDNYYMFYISPIHDAKGYEAGKLVILHDITDRKKAEDKIKQLNDELMLINKIVRHDILNDLQIVQGFLETEYKGDKNIYHKLMKRIEKIVRLMKRAKDLEHLASINEEFKEYDMKEVVENVAKEYDIEINIHGNCKIKADDAIYSVIDNIIMNAILHGKASQIDVMIEKNEEGCTIKIADNGKGIPDEIKSRIFDEKFSYGKSRGSGLGLYIVKKMIEKYGWEIEVRDNKPKGAMFIIKVKK